MAQSLDEEAPAGGASPTSSVGSFVPLPQEDPADKTRRAISFWLLALLTGLLLASFAALFLINGGASQDPKADSDRMLSLINIVFGPVVTLVSSVVGFYFGARTAQEGGTG